jgi:hypothetical protein
MAVRLPPENETYYWSFDPEGLDRLPHDALDKLTLPCASFQAFVYGAQWSKEVYDSIADWDRAKGFDPTTPDVAIELGYPLVDVERLNDIINAETVPTLGSKRRRHST